jgi:hypothetical protein
MRNSDPSRKRVRRLADSGVSSPSQTEPANLARPGGLRSSPDVEAEATVREDPHEQYGGEKRADCTLQSATENPAEKRSDDAEPNVDGKAAHSVAEASPDGTASFGVDAGGSKTELYAARSKTELYNEAKDAGIEGRSAMNKEQLVKALRNLRASNSAHEPSTRQALGQRPPTRRHSRSGVRPALSEDDSAEAVRPVADASGPERCAIVYRATGRHGEFQVVLTEAGDSRRYVARSPAFPAPTYGALRRRGAARVAHELLVSRLEACGWWPVDAGGPWHRLGFVRRRVEGIRSRRSLVTVAREAGQARFVAEELDTYGKPTPLVISSPFRAPRFLPLRPSRQARAALKELVGRMESMGWKAAVAVGKEHWYAISLWRP